MRPASNAARTLRLALTAAAVALAAAAACGGLTTGTPVNIPGGGIGVTGSDAGPDGGVDGGLDGGGDAGPDGGADAGCTTLSLTTRVVDGCFHYNTLQLNATGCGPISFSFDNTPVCTGTLGNNDSFVGSCGSLSCRATSLPGTIVCNNGPDAGGCDILVCQPGGTCP